MATVAMRKDAQDRIEELSSFLYEQAGAITEYSAAFLLETDGIQESFMV